MIFVCVSGAGGIFGLAMSVSLAGGRIERLCGVSFCFVFLCLCVGGGGRGGVRGDAEAN